MREFSAFGDDNREAINAQIDVLENHWDEDDVDDRLADAAENVRFAALDAAQWLAGEAADEGKPSDGWQSLAS